MLDLGIFSDAAIRPCRMDPDIAACDPLYFVLWDLLGYLKLYVRTDILPSVLDEE